MWTAYIRGFVLLSIVHSGDNNFGLSDEVIFLHVSVQHQSFCKPKHI